MDGLAFRLLAKRKDATEVFSAWILMLELASKATPRGDLSHNNVPLSPGEMGEITGFPGDVFSRALKFLCDPKIGWIEEISASPDVPGFVPDVPGFVPENIPLKEEKEQNEGKGSGGRFAPPTLQEVSSYCQEKGYTAVDPVKWMAHYTSNGWKVGRNPMKDWRAAVVTWQRNSSAAPSPKSENPQLNGNAWAASQIV